MATRQYIGARYVPKFYQNSVDGSAQWESNVVYEPLTYVTLTNGHMYISKKQVPATIGTPASNADYWLDIGSYNGFIDELNDRIDSIITIIAPAFNTATTYLKGDLVTKDDVLYIFTGGHQGAWTGTDVAATDIATVISDIKTELEDEINNGSVIIIGNSYVYNGVADELKTCYANNFVEYGGSGSGFVAYSLQSNTYYDALATKIAALTTKQKSEIRSIVFVSAMGDSRAQQEISGYGASLKTACDNIEALVAANLPNCKFIGVTLAESRNVKSFSNNTWTNLFKLHQTFKEVFGQTSIKYLGWSGFNSLMSSTHFEADHYHPSAAGAVAIGHDIVKQVFGGFEYKILTANNAVNVDDYSSGTIFNIYESLTPEGGTLVFRQFIPANVVPSFASQSVLLDTGDLTYPMPSFNEVVMQMVIKRGSSIAFEGVIRWSADSNGCLVGTVANVDSVPSSAPASNNHFCLPCQMEIV